MKLFICIFSIILAASSAPADQNDALQTVGSMKLLINHDVRVTHDQAMAFCRNRGLELISLQTKEKDNLVSDFLMKNVDHHVHFWTSGKRQNLSDSTVDMNSVIFEWSTFHQLFVYRNWEQRSPRPGKNCVSLVEDHRVNAYNWHTEDCNSTNAVICEKIN